MANGGYNWSGDGERDVYKAAVLACLDNARLRELLTRRPWVTDDAAAEAMCSAPYVRDALGRNGRRRMHLWYRIFRWKSDPYRWAMPTPTLREFWDSRGFGLWWKWGLAAVFGAGLAGNTPVRWYVLVAEVLVLLGVPLLSFAHRVDRALPAVGPPAPRRSAARVVLLAPVIFPLWFLERATELLWLRELQRNELGKVVERAVEDLIGDDLGTLLLPSSHDGLSSPRQREYFVDNRSAEELARKMDQLDGGTIAVSGPRGVGKTTLMEHGVEERDFAVSAHAPATYAPHEFLTSLFVRVCQVYIVRAGYEAPEFVRLSYLHSAARRVVRPLRRLARWLAFAVPAGVLVTLGLFASERSFESEHGAWLRRHFDSMWDRGTAFVGDVLGGRDPEAALALVLAGMLIWILRRQRHVFRLVTKPADFLWDLALIAMFTGPFISLPFDPGIRHHVAAVLYWPVILPLLVFFIWSRYDNPTLGPTLHVGPWSLDRKRIFKPLTTLFAFAGVGLLAAVDSTRPLVTDSENPLRISVLILAVFFNALDDRPWAFLRSTPKLVVDCRNHLYRLQTVQSATAALTSGATQLLTLGTSHTTGLTSVPPNYPALVGEFRTLLSAIAEEEHGKGNRVVIAIDEVDRLGTDTQALAFLREIKAILGVPHVHYLISVAEDVGAAFVRRGLPSRDVTDSSLDDVLHMRRCTLAESEAILKKRAPGIGEPYALLAHALSGGLPRDLIRYGRRLLEIRLATERYELSDVALTLIIEELSETLAGFRTLLAKQQWTPQTQGVLTSFRVLGAHLRGACPCPEPVDQLRGALKHFVAYEVTGLPDESRALIDEAAAYAYLSLTLLDIFGGPGFSRRRGEALLRSPDGNPDLLAEARQELAVSPYSVRPLVEGIRRAWQLEAVSAQGPHTTVVIPPPRSAACVGNH
ncbi:hypothetical protein ACI2L1_03570 [Streptomyces sp. NPDC019531]|uniref:hypothetical protein n=1 Tax=Streptomyces sp. NPDC019531 TaxID=3365062 RepID=UPI00384E7953